MNVKLFNASLLTACVLLASASPVSASGYTFSDLGTLDGLGRIVSSAAAINNAGQIVGFSGVLDLPKGIIESHATLWNDGGQVTDLGTLGERSYATGINDSGQVVGFFNADNKYRLPVTWHGTTMTTLDTLFSEPFGEALGINSTGQIVGFDSGLPALWNGTTLTTLDGVGGFGDSGVVNAINDAGEMAGLAGFSRHWSAARWDGATPILLDRLPDSQGSYAYAINNSGQIVGYDVDGSSGQRLGGSRSHLFRAA